MRSELKTIYDEALAAIRSAENDQQIQSVKSNFIGKKGALTQQMSRIRELPPEDRKQFGADINEIKDLLAAALEAKEIELKGSKLQKKIESQRLDPTLPGFRFQQGRFHPLTLVWLEAVEIFTNMGFDVVDGPEIETEWYNFEALNLDADHPARDQQDSFYLSPSTLMRTQTSPVQIRTMEKMGKPPVQIVAPGRTYRRDTPDASHSPVFGQIEGLMVDKNLSMKHLKATLEAFNREMFGPSVRTRFRPDFFPFTEPSAEVAISCIICGGSGCGLCKRTGWIEILGSGMVHPQVLRNAGFDPSECSGFAFGIGIERVAMLKYSIDDIRLFYENDIRFLKQF